MFIYKVSFVLLICLFVILSCENKKIKNYNELTEYVQNLEKTDRIDDAIYLLELNSHRFPEQEFETSKTLADLYTRTGQIDKCIEIWSNGHRKGYFYALFPQFPKYTQFAEHEQFLLISEKDLQIRKDSISVSKLHFEVVLPENYASNYLHPLIIIFHGGGSSIEIAKEHWQSSQLNEKYIAVFVQSYLYLDMKTYSWGIRDQRTRKDVKSIYEEIVRDYSIDTNQTILAGISAGGYTAMDLAIHNILPIKNLIAICPDSEISDFDMQSIQNSSLRGLNAIIVTGENDYLLNQQIELCELFKQYNLNTHLLIIPGMDHQYPGKFETILDSILNSLQETSAIDRWEYLGQIKPGVVPEVFAPDIISTSGKEFACTFSPDGKEFYFTRSGGEMELTTNTIMVTRYNGDNWSEPQIANFSGRYFDFEPHISPDGKFLYFGSRRPVNNQSHEGDMHQWYVIKTDTGWTSPNLLGNPFVDFQVMYISISKHRNLYFSEDSNEAGIWVSKFINGIYREPEKLPAEINYLQAVLHPFISPDEEYLLFDAKPDRQSENSDIYFSFRDKDGLWQKAQSLGKKVNISHEMCPSVSYDGKFLFFSRLGDIYWVSTEIFNSLKVQE